MDYTSSECLIVCFTDEKYTNDLLKGLLTDVYTESDTYKGIPSFYTWMISNKYFDANVKICCCNSKDFLENQNNFKLLEAVVFLFDIKEASGFTEIQKTSSFFQDDNPEVRLLWDSTQAQTEEKVKDDIFTWCIDHQIEFVENAEPSDDDNSIDDDEGFFTKYGIDRITEALNSHVWRNHHLKGEEHTTASCRDEAPKQTSKNDEDKIFAGGESFEEIFGKFNLMKEEAQGLEGNARKDYAEKVALAFMDAFGDDDDHEEKEDR